MASAAATSAAQETIKCKSKNGKYNECDAPFTAPILVRQTSDKPCIINSTWGFNRQTRRIWVAGGCKGFFGDAHGYHYGASGGFDKDARRYNRNGAFVGIGPFVINNIKIKNKMQLNLDGEGGIGTHFDADQRQDDSWQRIPQFDKNGNPNFDTDGNYQGPHGLGALVDAPTQCDPDEGTDC